MNPDMALEAFEVTTVAFLHRIILQFSLPLETNTAATSMEYSSRDTLRDKLKIGYVLAKNKPIYKLAFC